MRYWPTFIADVDSRTYHAQTEEARRALIELIIEIADDFLAPTQTVQTEAPRGNPPGGTVYDIYDWVNPSPELRDPPIEIIESAFAELEDPSPEVIAKILADERLILKKPGTEMCVYEVWIGSRAAHNLGIFLTYIEVEPEMRDTAGAGEDFRRLQPLLDQKIPRDPLHSLVRALFELSPKLALRELDVAHEPFVKTMLAFYARRHARKSGNRSS